MDQVRSFRRKQALKQVINGFSSILHAVGPSVLIQGTGVQPGATAAVLSGWQTVLTISCSPVLTELQTEICLHVFEVQ